MDDDDDDRKDPNATHVYFCPNQWSSKHAQLNGSFHSSNAFQQIWIFLLTQIQLPTQPHKEHLSGELHHCELLREEQKANNSAK